MKRRAKTLAFRPPVGVRDATPDEVVIEFRDSLKRGDVLGVAALLDTEARRPAERDVLIDLSAAEGPEQAVRKLSRFWRDAESRATCTRIVSEAEAEVYETIEVPKLPTPIHSVTLLRRRDEHWKVVFTVNAPDTRARLELDAMAARDQPVSALAAELPRYAIWKTKIELSREKVPAALDALEHHFHEATSDRLDGLRLDWQHADGSGAWLLVRGSNTEPIVRIIAEAPTGEEAHRLCENARQIIASVQ